MCANITMDNTIMELLVAANIQGTNLSMTTRYRYNKKLMKMTTNYTIVHWVKKREPLDQNTASQSKRKFALTNRKLSEVSFYNKTDCVVYLSELISHG